MFSHKTAVLALSLAVFSQSAAFAESGDDRSPTQKGLDSETAEQWLRGVTEKRPADDNVLLKQFEQYAIPVLASAAGISPAVLRGLTGNTTTAVEEAVQAGKPTSVVARITQPDHSVAKTAKMTGIGGFAVFVYENGPAIIRYLTANGLTPDQQKVYGYCDENGIRACALKYEQYDSTGLLRAAAKGEGDGNRAKDAMVDYLKNSP